jgi:sugar-specific transcriptional regulator TrmB
VLLTNGKDSTKVAINSTDVLPGQYTLVLESIEAKSDLPELILKTDTIKIVVTSIENVEEFSDTLPFFVDELKTETIITTEFKDWSLPPISENRATLKDIKIEADPLIADQISYEKNTGKISFSGKGISSVTSQQMVKIKITLVNSFGENLYS